MNLRFVFSLIVSLLSLLPAAAQDLTRNWIRERIFLDAEGKKCVTSVQYFDGIGRETLLLTDGLSPGGGVAGALTEESFAGRTSSKWLPATGLTGLDFLTPERIKPLAVSSHEGDSVPFSLTRRDALGRVASLSYDALGRVVGNTLPGKAGRIAYSYNIRNLVTEVEGKGYKGITAYTPGRFNGSPSSATDVYSPTPETGASGTDTTRWSYFYDALGRLTEAEAVSGDRKHTETTAFDANGNVVRLARWADYAPMLNTMADNLYFTLDGNRPLSISDRGVNLAYAGSFDFKNRGRSGEYVYDGNGKLVSDPYKGMTVTYADWGTPEKITFDDGNHTAFTYTASGEKLKTEWRSGAANLRAGEGSPAVQAAVINSEEFFGPFVCKDGRLDKFLFDGGFCDLSSGVAQYRYFVRDRLGCVRSVADEDGQVLQQNLYYAWGGTWGDVYTASEFQQYKYCGKYLDRKHGLDLYDYGARQYDPAAAFWTSPDPLCEKYYNISPYAFCNNNPVTFIDPDGRFIDTAWDAANVAMGVTSFVANVTAGNIVGAALDGAGLIVDVAATAIPGVPGGAATAIKAVRGVKIAEKVVKNAAVKSAVRKGVKKVASKTKPYAKHRPSLKKETILETWNRHKKRRFCLRPVYTKFKIGMGR